MRDECPTPWKVSYETRTIAKSALWKGRHGITYKGQMRPYRCPGCGMWHLTSMCRNELRRVKKAMRK